MTPKPTVLVDIDDTLSDTQHAMLSYINTHGSRQYRFEELTRAHREEGVEEYEELVQEFLSQPKLVRQCRPLQNAIDGLRQLHAAGYEIHIVSSRKELLHETTRDWLADHGFADYVDMIHPRSSRYKGKDFKQVVADRIKPAVAFDDTLEVVEVLAGGGVLTYLINQPWNADGQLPKNVRRAESFAAAVDDFLNRSQE